MLQLRRRLNESGSAVGLSSFVRHDWDSIIKLRDLRDGAHLRDSNQPLAGPGIQSRVFDTTWPVTLGDSEPAMFSLPSAGTLRSPISAISASRVVQHVQDVFGGKKRNDTIAYYG